DRPRAAPGERLRPRRRGRPRGKRRHPLRCGLATDAAPGPRVRRPPRPNRAIVRRDHGDSRRARPRSRSPPPRHTSAPLRVPVRSSGRVAHRRVAPDEAARAELRATSGFSRRTPYEILARAGDDADHVPLSKLTRIEPSALRGPLALAALYVVPLVLWVQAAPLRPRFTGQFSTLTSIAVLFAFAGASAFALNLVLGARLRPVETFFGGLDR